MDFKELTEIRSLFDEFEYNYLKLINTNNKSASPRARKALLNIMKHCKSLRVKCIEHVKKQPKKHRNKDNTNKVG